MQVDEKKIDWFIQQALQEDVGTGDVTTLACIPPEARAKAQLLVKDEGILAGVGLAQRILRAVDPSVQIQTHLHDGDEIQPGQVAFEVEGNTHALLKAERLLLNAMQRMSGIATMCGIFREAVDGIPVTILDTRKTTPLLRFLEKWAVRLGGCSNYRFGLHDWFMIKDNHVAASGGIRPAIERVVRYRAAHRLDLRITVEVSSFEELEEVLRTGQVNRIMLDNFPAPALREAVERIENRFETEASGGVTLENLRRVAETGVDFISVGALTHSFRSLDLSLKIVAGA